MAQIKIFGLKSELDSIKRQLSDVVHSCIVEALAFPAEKRFHRFFPLDADNFIYPADRTSRYTIIEISMFAGRSVETKKQLIRLLFERIQKEIGIATNDLEITVSETPRCNWGIRGLPGDELMLGYNVNT